MGGGLQHGGIVRIPSLRMLAEAGPEAVIPLSQMDGMGGVTVVNLFRESELAAVTASALARGSQIMVNEVLAGVQGNRAIRRMMQRST